MLHRPCGRAQTPAAPLNECRPQSLAKINESFEAAGVAHQEAEKAEHLASEDMLIACIEVLQAENELLRCEKAASDRLVQQLISA